MRKKHRVENAIQWAETWRRIQQEIFKHESPLHIRQAALAKDTTCRKQGDAMVIRVPAVIEEYIEQHMSAFKDILWPFIQSHHCSKLIYDHE